MDESARAILDSGFPESDGAPAVRDRDLTIDHVEDRQDLDPAGVPDTAKIGIRQQLRRPWQETGQRCGWTDTGICLTRFAEGCHWPVCVHETLTHVSARRASELVDDLNRLWAEIRRGCRG